MCSGEGSGHEGSGHEGKWSQEVHLGSGDFVMAA